jgi:hypothetical protein
MSDVKRNEHMLPIANWLREQINEVLARYDIPSDVYDYDILIDALCVCAVDKSQAAIRADLPPTDAEVLNHPKVKALVEAAEEQLDYLEMCGEDDDLVRNLRSAIAAIQEAKP